MTDTSRAISLAPAGTALTLLVARASGKRVVGGQVAVADDALTVLRQNVENARAAHETRTSAPYYPDGEIEAEEYFYVPRADVEDSMKVLELLDRGPETAALDPAEIPERRQTFYAVITGDDPTARVAYVTHSNPAKVAHSGFFLTPKRQALTRIETPVLLFEDRVDLIVTSDTIVINDQKTFEQWFRDTPALQERVGKWIGNITEHLPLAADGAARLEGQCRQHPRLRRTLYAIQQRGHLKDVRLSKIRRHITEQGLDDDALVKDGKLVFDDANPARLLKLLNEDLFRGGLTDEPFTADRKRPRR